MKKLCWLVMLSLLTLSFTTMALPVKIVKKTVEEVVELAAKKSGKILSPAAKKTAEKAMQAAIQQYGDDALKAVEKGGLEIIFQGSKYGDDFWKICAKSSPEAVRSLALHADELMPVVKRCGNDFLELEGKVPGLGLKTIDTFGDSAVQTFKNAPSSHITQMLGYAGKAESRQTVQLLHEGYAKSAGKILDHLNWKNIMAYGLSTAAVVAACNASGPLETLAKTNPELFADVFIKIAVWGIFLILLFFVVFIYPTPSRIISGTIKLCKRNSSDSEKTLNKTKKEAE